MQLPSNLPVKFRFIIDPVGFARFAHDLPPLKVAQNPIYIFSGTLAIAARCA